jgi:hypothetical protein
VIQDLMTRCIMQGKAEQLSREDLKGKIITGEFENEAY